MILGTEAATEALGRAIAAQLRTGDVVTLSGGLGVGKTTLTRAILRGLCHEGEVPSPTFALVQPYDELDPPVWHVDLYRIEHHHEIAELGLDSAGQAALIVEWPERAGEGAWSGALELCLEFAEAGARRLTAKVPPAWQGRWPSR